MTVEPGTRLRADARRNRDQIIAAAKVVFVESGPDVPMEEIARRAGVGTGTLYRRFPDREALIRAVAQANFGSIVDDARLAAAEEPTAWDALVRLLGRSRDLRLGVRLALLSTQSWNAVRDDPRIRRYRTEFMEILDDLVRRSQAEGVLRADVGAGDVAALVSLLLRRIPAGSDQLSEVILERTLVLVLDGLRANPGSPLPGNPVTAGDLELGNTRQPSHSRL
jgi:AcrR family transcriptional regulator